MPEPNTQVNWEYRTLLLIWAGLLSVGPMLLLVIYLTQPAIFEFDRSQPFIGERYIIVPVAVLLTIWDLFFSYYRHKNYLRQSIADKNPELVRTALITACLNTVAISLYGFFLAWIFGYQYFFVWVLLGSAATIFYYPRRSALLAAQSWN